MSHGMSQPRRLLVALIVIGLFVGACGSASPTVTASQPASVPMSSPSPSVRAEATASPSPTQTDAPEEATTLRVLAADVRLRAEAGLDADAVASVPAGATLPLLGGPTSVDGLDWYRTRFAGEDGWITSGDDGEWLGVVRSGRIAFGCNGCNDGGRGTLSADPLGDLDVQVLLDEYGRPAWAPDGSRVAIERTSAGSLPTLVIVTADGAEEQLALAGSGPTWSPDGELLAYVDPNDATLFVLDPDGEPVYGTSGDRVGFDVTDHGAPGAMAWSPDGTRIAFTAVDCPECPIGEPIFGDPPMAVFTFEPPDGAVVKVADGGNAGHLVWSPDGLALTFLELNLGTGSTELRRVTLADGNVEVVADSRPPTSFGYDYSPDGALVAFASADGIVVSNADGSDEELILPTASGGPAPIAPRWSPDGQWILYEVASGDGIVAARIVRADGTDDREVASEAFGADWQPVLEPLPPS